MFNSHSSLISMTKVKKLRKSLEGGEDRLRAPSTHNLNREEPPMQGDSLGFRSSGRPQPQACGTTRSVVHSPPDRSPSSYHLWNACLFLQGLKSQQLSVLQKERHLSLKKNRQIFDKFQQFK